MIAKIAVSTAVYAIDKPYDYAVPTELSPKTGQRVLVPFGRGDRVAEGIVLALEEGEGTGLKSLKEILDEQPLLDEKMLRLAAFMRERYFCTFYDAVRTVIPGGLWFRTMDRYRICTDNWREQIHRQPVATAVMESLQALGGTADWQELRKQFEELPLKKALRYLTEKGLLELTTLHSRKVRDKVEQLLSLAVPVQEARAIAEKKKRSAPIQSSVLELLADFGECSRKELSYYTGADSGVIKRLVALGLISLREETALRLPYVPGAEPKEPPVLSPEQQLAYEGLKREERKVSLLYGVTGSGKTSVYIRLIYDMLEQGRGAIVLVPEIALTPQLLSLFTSHFQDRVAVIHSSLRMTERCDTWKKIREGRATVVLGTRSAVFAPVQNLGLLILDEEQEHTYKSEQNPRYHARELAIYRSYHEGAKVILGSATPSVQSMYQAKEGVYGLYTLKQRYNRRRLPSVHIADLKQELRNGNPTPISRSLYEALEDNIQNHRQSILFLNRRGSSRLLCCVDCGHVPDCPGCSNHLTYHHANGRLMCHYCGYSVLVPQRCEACGGHYKQVGVGTQKIEQQLTELFGSGSVLRMDADTVSAANPHEKLLRRFKEERIPILLGTQMVTKGLDFENVTLVGVLDGDMSLYVGDYRAGENTFAMITQVVGRAGRGALEGRAVIQTMTPEHPVILLAASQDYDGFYEAELPLRRLRGCPPFQDQICLTFHGRQEDQLWQGAERFRQKLLTHIHSPFYRDEELRILGPAPCQIPRVNFVYRCRLTLICKNTRNLRLLLAHLIREFHKEKDNRGLGLYADAGGEE